MANSSTITGRLTKEEKDELFSELGKKDLNEGSHFEYQETGTEILEVKLSVKPVYIDAVCMVITGIRLRALGITEKIRVKA